MALIHGLQKGSLRGDFFGGLTAAVVALPLALAMGVASGAGPLAGLYGAVFVGFFAALFGGTPAQVSGPTGPMTVVMAAVFTQFTAMYPDDPARGAAMAFTVVILGGLFQILFGVLRVGRYINLIPHPVVSGFMSGIGVIIILLQLGPLLGHLSPPGPLEAALAVPDLIGQPVLGALALGVLALLIVYLTPSAINRLMPSPLLALIVGTLVLLVVGGGGAIDTSGVTATLSGVAVLGPIPSGFPSPQWPVFELAHLPDMLKAAVMLATLGTIDSLLTSLVADNLTRTQHQSDRELIGQGIGNAVSGLFGGLPGAGATMRTVVNVRVGGRTPVSGMWHALLLLGVLTGAGAIVQYIPHAVLAGILIKVGTDIIDWDYLRHLRTAPRSGMIIMASVFFITVFVDLITAVAVGVIMASLIFVERMSALQIDSITAVTDPASATPLSADEKALMEQAHGRVLLFHIGGPMSFGAAKGMAGNLARFDEYDVLVLDLSDVPLIDDSAIRALDDMIHDAQRKERAVLLVSGREAVSTRLDRRGIYRKLAEGAVFAQRKAALEQAVALLPA